MSKLSPEVIRERKERAIEALRLRLAHGQTIYTVCRYVNRARTGAIFAILIVENGEIKNISGSVSDALEREWDDCDGVWSNSAFDLVMSLSYALHGHKHKGRMNAKSCHPRATPTRFKAGYTFEHQPL